MSELILRLTTEDFRKHPEKVEAAFAQYADWDQKAEKQGAFFSSGKNKGPKGSELNKVLKKPLDRERFRQAFPPL